MILHFLDLEWKQFYRSTSFNKGITIKTLMGFMVLSIGLVYNFLKVIPQNTIAI